MNALTKRQENLPSISPEIINKIVLSGDLSGLSQTQKVEYYIGFCRQLGLEPASKPFQILNLNGKETLYCDRSGAAQLNQLHGISHELVESKIMNGLYIVVFKAFIKDRCTVNTGAVSIQGLNGEKLANAIMKAETKAKRRATLDLFGLGMLDESEVKTIEDAKTIEVYLDAEEKEEKANENNVKEAIGFIDKINQADSIESLKTFFSTTYNYCKKKGFGDELMNRLTAAKDLRKEHFESQKPYSTIVDREAIKNLSPTITEDELNNFKNDEDISQ